MGRQPHRGDRVPIDPETNELVKTIHIGGHPEGIAAGEGRVWVTVQ